MNKQLPVQLRSQTEAFELDDDTLYQQDKRKAGLQRFNVVLPVLNDSFDPNMSDLNAIYERMANFDIERGGLSYNTLRMMSFVIKRWDDYCKNKGAYSFPINPRVLLGWYKHIGANLSINTIRSYRTQIGIFHRNVLTTSNPNNDPLIQDYFRALRSDLALMRGEQQVEVQAKPFRRHHLEAIKKLWGNPFYPLEFRNLTLLTIAYATSLRESEICNIRMKHIEVLGDSIDIHRVSAKTSDSPIPKTLIGENAKTLRQFLELHCHDLKDDDFIFSKMTSLGNRPAVKRRVAMTGSTVDRIYAKAHDLVAPDDATVKGIRPKWTGHSARIGACIDAYVDKMEIADLIKLGDWTSPTMVMRYLKGVSKEESPNVTLQRAQHPPQ
jgi:integrase